MRPHLRSDATLFKFEKMDETPLRCFSSRLRSEPGAQVHASLYDQHQLSTCLLPKYPHSSIHSENWYGLRGADITCNSIVFG